jgi:hypothetical protein
MITLILYVDREKFHRISVVNGYACSMIRPKEGVLWELI